MTFLVKWLTLKRVQLHLNIDLKEPNYVLLGG